MAKSKRSTRAEPQQRITFWDKLSTAKQHAVLAVFLLVIPIFMFSDVFPGDKQFFAHDIKQWRGAAQSIIEDRETYDYEPLWAHNMYGGMPAYFISFPKMAKNVDDIINFIGRKSFPVGFMWLGLFGTYLLFLSLGAKPLPSSLGAVTFAFSTYIPIIIGAGHNSKFIAYNYIPWLILGYVLVMQSPKKRWLGLGLFALALTAELRAGHPQVTYYFGILLVLIWISDGYTKWKEKQMKDFAKLTGILIVATVISLMAIAQPYWSKTEFTPFSTRGGSSVEQTKGLDFDYAMAWSHDWGELLTLYIPGAYGGSSMEGTYWGPKTFTSGPHYLGAIPFLLFLLGLARWKHRLKWILLSGGILTMLFALGNEFLSFNRLMYEFVPYFNKFRTPEMWLIVTVFCFGAVAVFGLNGVLSTREEEKGFLFSTKEWVSIGVALGIALLFAVAPSSMLDFKRDGERSQLISQVAQSNGVSPQNPQVAQTVDRYINNELIPQRTAKATSDGVRALILVIIAIGVVVAVRMNKLAPAYAGVLLLLLTSYDLIQVGNRYISDSSKVDDSFDQERMMNGMKRPIDDYIVQNMKNSAQTWEYRTFPLIDSPYQSAVPSYFYPTIGGYTAVKVSIYQDLINATLDPSSGILNTEVLRMLNTRFITYTQPIKIEGFEPVFSDRSGVVMESAAVLPKAWFVDSLLVRKTSQEVLDELNKPSFDASDVAILEQDLPITLAQDSAARVEVITYEPRTIEVETERSTPGFLVLGEVYYPQGWKAFIDDTEIPIYKTNYVLRGVEIPAGKHTVRFTFNPKSFILGTTIAWIGNGLVFALFLFGLVTFFRSLGLPEPQED